tara:strand:+ start:176 stop:457 length:282 start_codon:yes stop_codon:yes gene_type:complete
MKAIAQGLSNSETISPSSLLPALPVITLFAQTLGAKFINNIRNIVRINTYPKRRIFPNLTGWIMHHVNKTVAPNVLSVSITPWALTASLSAYS